MNDIRLETRKDNFKKCTFNILEQREKFNLSLRKKKLDDFIMNKRIKVPTKFDKASEIVFNLEIDTSKLNIDRKFLNNGIKSLEEDGEVVINMLESKDLDYVKYAVNCLRKYFTHTDANGDVKENGGTMRCIFDSLAQKLLIIEDNNLLFEIYWTLVNMTASDLQDNTNLDLFACDQIIDSMYKHLFSEFIDIVENLVWFLNHLVSESYKFRDKLIESKIYEKVISFLLSKENSYDLLKNLIWLLSNTLKLTMTTPSEDKILQILNILSSYLYLNDLEILSHCLWGVYNVSNFEEKYPNLNNEILKSGSVVKMMSLNFKKCHLSLLPTLRILGNLCAGRFDIVDELISLKILDFFDAILTINKSVKKEVCWAISNITAGSYIQIDKVISSSVFDRVVEYLKDMDYRVKKESLWVIVNSSSCGVFDISSKLVGKGIISILCEIIRENTCHKLLLAALEALKNILTSAECIKDHQGFNIFLAEFDKFGGSSLLEKLQNHKNQDVFEFSNNLLVTFYSTESIN